MTLVAACQWLPSLLAMQQSLRTLHWQLLPHWQLLGSDSDSDSELESSESDLPSLRRGRGPRAAHRARPPPVQLTPSPAAESPRLLHADFAAAIRAGLPSDPFLGPLAAAAHSLVRRRHRHRSPAPPSRHRRIGGAGPADRLHAEVHGVLAAAKLPGYLGAALMIRTVLYCWPGDGWHPSRSTVTRLCPRSAFSHVMADTRH